MQYTKTIKINCTAVFILLSTIGENTIFILLAYKKKIPSIIIISRNITIVLTSQYTCPDIEKYKYIAVIKILSANGSKIAPNLEVILNFLARNPSKKSDATAIIKIQNDRRISFCTADTIIGSGDISRKKDNAFGILKKLMNLFIPMPYIERIKQLI